MTTLRRAYTHNPSNIGIGMLAGLFIVIALMANPLSVALPLSAVILINTGVTMWISENYRRLSSRVVVLNEKVEEDHQRVLKRVA